MLLRRPLGRHQSPMGRNLEPPIIPMSAIACSIVAAPNAVVRGHPILCRRTLRFTRGGRGTRNHPPELYSRPPPGASGCWQVSVKVMTVGWMEGESGSGAW